MTYLTLPQQFVATAERLAGRPALRYKHGGTYVTISFAELHKRVAAFAVGLQERGVIPGDRVAILAPNCPEWVIADLAIQWLGGISVPIHTTLSPTLIGHILEDSSSRVLIVIGMNQWIKFAAIGNPLSHLELTISADVPASVIGEGAPHKPNIAFDDVAHQHAPTPAAPWADATSVASIVYTSGTTGIPKGVMLTHINFISNAQAALDAIPITEHDTFLSFLPLSHVFERTAGYYVPLLVAGACVAYAENPKVLQDNLREIRPTVLIAVPRLFEKLHDTIWAKVNAGSALKRKLFVSALKARPHTWQHWIFDRLVFKKIRQRLGGKLRVVVSGGASLNPKLGKFFDRVGLSIVEGYGMTEASPIIAANRLDNHAFGTVGQPITGVEVQIGDNKEIIVRGPNIMAGYHNHPEITRQMIDEKGWLHTGDQGFIDAAGRLTIIGRTKEMLVTAGGKNVWPEPIEFALNDDRMIAQSMVVGDGKKFISVLIVPFWPAVLELAARHHLPPDPKVLVTHPKIIEEFSQRIERINSHLADWEHIRRFRLLLEEFTQERDELTPTLKLRRRAIHHHYKDTIDQLYQTE